MKTILALLTLASFQGAAQVEKRNPSLEDMLRMRVVLELPGMAAVNVRRDLTYKTADGHPLYMDVYSPPGSAPPRPAVILIHGGPIPRTGAKNMGVFVSYGELLAASGLIAITFDHRFLTEERIADAAGDVADLVAHVRKNAAALGVDADRLALWAFSGGGPFLVQSLRERPTWLRAIIAFYAVLDLQRPAPGDHNRTSTEVRRAFSALDALGQSARSVPPMLVARAGLDNPWLNGTIDRFIEKGLNSGAALDVLNHPDGRHSFDILDNDVRSKQIIRRTVEFLRDNLTK